MTIQWKDSLVDVGHDVLLSVRLGQHVDQDPLKPVIVFLHEALGCIAMWKNIPEIMAQSTGCDVLVYERLGYGQSTPIELPRDEDYLIHEGEIWLPRLLEKLNLNRVILFGHSDGGSIALIGAGHLPGKVTCVVTEAAHIYIDHLTRKGIEEAVELWETTNLNERLAKYHGERTEVLFRAWHETWLRERKAPMDFTPWLPRIECAALIIQGEDDQYGVPEQVTDICQGIGARAKPLFLPDCGHIPHFEAKEPLIEAATEFILQHLDD